MKGVFVITNQYNDLMARIEKLFLGSIIRYSINSAMLYNLKLRLMKVELQRKMLQTEKT